MTTLKLTYCVSLCLSTFIFRNVAIDNDKLFTSKSRSFWNIRSLPCQTESQTLWLFTSESAVKSMLVNPQVNNRVAFKLLAWSFCWWEWQQHNTYNMKFTIWIFIMWLFLVPCVIIGEYLIFCKNIWLNE